MLRVLILSKSFEAPGGVVNFIHSLITHLPTEAIAQHLAIGRPPGREGSPSTWLAPLWDNLRLIRTVRRDRPDCVHINPSLNWPSLLRDGAFLLCLRLLGFRSSLVFFHGWDPQVAQGIRASRLKSWLVRRMLDRAAVICVLASTFRQVLVDIGIDADRIHVVSTMYDTSIFDDVASRPGASPRILFLGRLVAEKGAMETLEAFALLRERMPTATLTIAGEGVETTKLKARTASLGLEDSVHFPGYLKGRSKGRALADADLFVFPTRYGEGCPVSLLEAMAAGVPIVTTAVGGIPDIFRDQINGTLLDAPHPREIAAAMERWLSDCGAARACGERNRRTADGFTGAVVAERIFRLYETAAR